MTIRMRCGSHFRLHHASENENFQQSDRPNPPPLSLWVLGFAAPDVPAAPGRSSRTFEKNMKSIHHAIFAILIPITSVFSQDVFVSKPVLMGNVPAKVKKYDSTTKAWVEA